MAKNVADGRFHPLSVFPIEILKKFEGTYESEGRSRDGLWLRGPTL
jgi:hypothetical protein